MFDDTFEGQTNYCIHETTNKSGICNACLGQKRKQPKIKVSFVKVHYDEDYDFGLFPSKKQIQVNPEFWEKYVLVREEFMGMHSEMIQLANKK